MFYSITRSHEIAIKQRLITKVSEEREHRVAPFENYSRRDREREREKECEVDGGRRDGKEDKAEKIASGEFSWQGIFLQR